MTSSLKKRNQLIPESLDESDLAPTLAKWLTSFRYQAVQNAIYFDVFINSESEVQRLAAARCIPFLIGISPEFRSFLPEALEILSEHSDELSAAAWTPFRQVLADLPEVALDLPSVGKLPTSGEIILVNDTKIDKATLCARNDSNLFPPPI